MNDLIAEATFNVTGESPFTLEIKIGRPVIVAATGNYGCSCEIVAGSRTESYVIFGANTLQALLLALNQVADDIAEILKEVSGTIECVVWDTLKRVETPPEVWEAAMREYLADERDV